MKFFVSDVTRLYFRIIVWTTIDISEENARIREADGKVGLLNSAAPNVNPFKNEKYLVFCLTRLFNILFKITTNGQASKNI